MANQVLALHRVSPRCYDLTRIRTGNMRDQLLRSTVMVNALRADGLIGKGWPLLVYGAGPAGMNAAMHAAEHKIDVVVVERTRTLFATVHKASWRRVDPTEYDWPHAHWSTGAFPRAGKTIPLGQPFAASGLALALAWRRHWQAFAARVAGNAERYGHVEVLRGVDANLVELGDRGQGALLAATGPWTEGSPARTTRYFGALMSCAGFGEELVTEEPCNGLWNGYAGPRFWHDNDRLQRDVALSDDITNVVISGGGDGAMQDFQRIAANHSLFGRELYVELRKYIHGKTHQYKKPYFPNAEQRNKFQTAEETGRRAFGWASDRRGVPRSMAQWHDAFADPIDKIVKSWRGKVVDEICDQVFRPELLQEGRLKITWIMQEPTTGYAYALNRYLSLMLAALARNRTHALDVSVLNSWAIHSIVPIDHVCTNASGCIGRPHRVIIRPLCNHGEQRMELANLIIIRHGLEPQPLLLGGRLPVPEQIAPFDLPN